MTTALLKEVPPLSTSARVIVGEALLGVVFLLLECLVRFTALLVLFGVLETQSKKLSRLLIEIQDIFLIFEVILEGRVNTDVKYFLNWITHTISISIAITSQLGIP